MPLNPGDMRHRVTVQRQLEVGRDSYNQPVVEFVSVRTVWAQVLPKREDEAHAASQRYASQTMTFRTWHMPDVSAQDRLVFGGQVFDIIGARELGFREATEISAVAHVDEPVEVE